MRFVKGHGTENDFVLLPDPDASLDVTPGLVAAICDRRRGIGADGVLRVVRTKAIAEASGSGLGGQDGAEWFMDYRNADGSLAEMCGNGIRVFARYLVDAGFAAPGELAIATRAGVKAVIVPADGEVTVDMGSSEVTGHGTAVIAGAPYDGLRVSLGNPHLVCAVEDSLARLDLTTAPDVDRSAFPDGVNVEVVQTVDRDHVRMRVHERGSGETRSCGTGAVAAAVAASHHEGGSYGTWRVDVPGGTLTVTLDEETSYLTGPAELVADGDLRYPDRR